jgi:hypothetical protein
LERQRFSKRGNPFCRGDSKRGDGVPSFVERKALLLKETFELLKDSKSKTKFKIKN